MKDYLILIPFSAFIFVFYIFAYISGQRKRSPVKTSFQVFFFFLMISPLIDFLIHLPLPRKFTLFLTNLSIPMILPLGFLFLNFVFTLINKKRNSGYWLCLFAVIASTVYLKFVPPFTMSHFPGYNVPLPVPSSGFIIPFILTILVIPFYASILCLKFIKESQSIILSRQLRLLALGTFISTSVTAFTLFIHLISYGYIILHFSSIGIITSALFMFVAIQKHFLLSVNIDQIENAFNRLFENSHDSVLLLDEQGIAIQVNNCAKSLLGQKVCNCNKVFLEKSIPEYNFSLNGTYITGILQKNREIKHLQISQSLIKNNDISLGKLLIIRDISAQKKAEQLMLNSKNMDSLGRLAGGIAHDFNNLLCGIASNLSLAKLHLEPNSKATELITMSEKTALNARDLARQLLTFSKIDNRNKQIFDLVELINDTSSFLAHGSSILISSDLPKSPVFIEADKGKMRQVFQNIILNGLESMSDGKTLRIRGNIVYLNSDIAPYNREGEYFEISISDQGIGIPEDNLSRIFEPYFTTKQDGNGLGLAFVNTIISRTHGSITVSSQLNEGTTFTIRLPVIKDTLKNQVHLPINTDIPHGRILVVDDIPTIRLSLALLLQQMGFTVDQASSGNQALELYEQTTQNNDSYQAVITDLTVPGAMGGKELARELKKRDPDLCIIVSSGYSEEIELSRFRDFGFSGVLHKPYTTEELKVTMDSVLSLSPA